MVSAWGAGHCRHSKRGLSPMSSSTKSRVFETTQTGEVLSRLTTDTTLIQTVVGTSISFLALRNFLLSVVAVMLFVTSPMLSSIIIVTRPLSFSHHPFFGRVRKLSRDSQDRIADASALAGEILNQCRRCKLLLTKNRSSTIFCFSGECLQDRHASNSRDRC